MTRDGDAGSGLGGRMLDRCRIKAEAELARAQRTYDDDLRRHLFLRVGILFSPASGGGRRAKGQRSVAY